MNRSDTRNNISHRHVMCLRFSVQMSASYRNFPSTSSDYDREDILDAQNRQLTENLSSKVSRLKNLAYDIESETKEHQSLLDGLSDDVESGSGLLNGSLNRVYGVLNSGRRNRKSTLYIAIFVVVLILFLYITFTIFKSTNSNTN